VDAAGIVKSKGKQLVLNAFNVALTHAQSLYADKAPLASLPGWESGVTRRILVGAETYRYTAGRLDGDDHLPGGPADKMVFNHHHPERGDRLFRG